MPAVTISAGYGAGGSLVAPEVASLLGVALLDRAISVEVAEQLSVSVDEATEGELKKSRAGRFLELLAPLSGGLLGAGTDAAPADAFPLAADSDLFREQAELIIRRALPDGAVILGRAGAAALRLEPQVLRVRLFGPEEARIEQAARLGNIDTQTAAKRLDQVDRARAHYVRRLYGVDIDDPALYHVQLDSTTLPLAACADLIADAYKLLVAAT
jgi:hypothetical protein